MILFILALRHSLRPIAITLVRFRRRIRTLRLTTLPPPPPPADSAVFSPPSPPPSPPTSSRSGYNISSITADGYIVAHTSCGQGTTALRHPSLGGLKLRERRAADLAERIDTLEDKLALLETMILSLVICPSWQVGCRNQRAECWR